MENQELLTAISAMISPINDKLNAIDGRLDAIDGRLESLEVEQAALQEGLVEVRSGVNALLEWSEGVGEKFEMPLRPAQ